MTCLLQELKDQADELTMELEELSQRLAQSRKQERPQRSPETLPDSRAVHLSASGTN